MLRCSPEGFRLIRNARHEHVRAGPTPGNHRRCGTVPGAHAQGHNPFRPPAAASRCLALQQPRHNLEMAGVPLREINVTESGKYFVYVRSHGVSDSSFRVSIGDKQPATLFGNGPLTFKSGGSLELKEREVQRSLESRGIGSHRRRYLPRAGAHQRSQLPGSRPAIVGAFA